MDKLWKTVMSLECYERGDLERKAEINTTDCTSHQMIDHFINLMRFQSFTEDAIQDAIIEKADEIRGTYETFQDDH